MIEMKKTTEIDCKSKKSNKTERDENRKRLIRRSASVRKSWPRRSERRNSKSNKNRNRLTRLTLRMAWCLVRAR